MKKKAPTRRRINYEDALKIAAKEEVAFFGQCQKFKDRPIDLAPVDRAIHFLFLKENVIYFILPQLRMQIERKLYNLECIINGPADYRIMKTNKLISGAINGWYNGAAEAKFDLGSGFTIDIGKKKEKSFHFKDNNDYIDLRVQTQERDKISMQKFEFSKLNTQRLTQKLCKLKEETYQQNNEPKLYVEVAGQKIFHLVNQDHQNTSLLQEFQAFSTIEDIVRLHEVKSLQKIELHNNTQESSSEKLRERAMTNLHDQRQILFQKKRLSAQTEEDSQKIYKKLLKSLRSDDQYIISSKQPQKMLQINYQNTSRRNSPQSFFFNLSNKQTVPSNTSISNSQYDSNYQKPQIQNTQQTEQLTDFLEQKVDKFIRQKFIIQNTKSLSPDIDYSNLQQKQYLFKKLRQKEIQRIQKIRINSQR